MDDYERGWRSAPDRSTWARQFAERDAQWTNERLRLDDQHPSPPRVDLVDRTPNANRHFERLSPRFPT